MKDTEDELHYTEMKTTETLLCDSVANCQRFDNGIYTFQP